MRVVRGSGPGPWADAPLAEVVRENRERLGLSQVDFAAMTGMSQSEVSQLERGWIAAPSLERMQNMAHVFGMPIEEMLRQTHWVGRDDEVSIRSSQFWMVGGDPMAELINEARDLDAGSLAMLVRMARVLKAGAQ